MSGQVRHLLVQHLFGLLTLADMAVCLPPFPWQPHANFYNDQLPPIPIPTQRTIPAGLLPVNTVPFSERCLQMATVLYVSVANEQKVIEGKTLQRFLRVSNKLCFFLLRM